MGKKETGAVTCVPCMRAPLHGLYNFFFPFDCNLYYDEIKTIVFRFFFLSFLEGNFVLRKHKEEEERKAKKKHNVKKMVTKTEKW